jgi:hypothetical protein
VAKFFRRVSLPVRPAPEPGKAARARRRCAFQRGSVESSRVAETCILSALLRYRRFSAANFVKQNLCAGALAQGKRRARDGTERRRRYTQN